MYDPVTGFFLGDPQRPPFSPGWKPDKQKLLGSFDTMILSASGWRKVFAADNNQDSCAPFVNPEDLFLAALAADVFCSYAKKVSGKSSLRILLGCDSRPTGAALADVMLWVFAARDLAVNYLFITAAPEIMAWAQADPEIDGFAYISASHNPLGYNGFKFGLGEGGVLDGQAAARLIVLYKEAVSQAEIWDELIRAATAVDSRKIESAFLDLEKNKKNALEKYRRFTRLLVSRQTEPAKQDAFFETVRAGARKNGLGLLGEFNGSARGLSIDRNLFESAGLVFAGLNEKPRQVVHAIIPEGASLDLCRRELERLHRENPAYVLGYVPDNDGDRGNLVYWNRKTQSAEILQAQEVFALSVLGELAYSASLSPGQNSKQAVVVNGPTSLRIEEIAGAFGAGVFRAEVGEANVVNRARELRREGWQVPILGEGSNGGSITHPASVRDPLNTLFAILKLLLLKGEKNNPGLFENWCRLSGQADRFYDGFDLADIIASLPVYTTTPASESRAVMKIQSQDHRQLKENYEALFLKEWEKHRENLAALGIAAWKEINYEGTQEKEGFGPAFRSGKETGGLKIQFHGFENEPLGFIWMRGSGTEPVFRLMAEIRGENPAGEAWLLEWQRGLIEEADGCIR